MSLLQRQDFVACRTKLTDGLDAVGSLAPLDRMLRTSSRTTTMGSFVSRRKASVVRRSISVIFSFFIACKSSELPRIPYFYLLIMADYLSVIS